MPLMTRMTSLGSTPLRRMPDTPPASTSSRNAPRICSRVWAEERGIARGGGAQGVTHAALCGNVVCKPLRPCAQRLVRGTRREKIRSRGAQRVHLVLVSRDDERVPIREVAVQGADADAGARRDGLQGRVLALRGERLCRRGKQLFAVALRVGT